jgi:ankyrin repeat protein
LLEAGTPVASKGDRSHGTVDGSLLQLAIESSNTAVRADMLKLLLKSRAVSSDRNGKQRALARAVQQGDFDLARALIEAGADPTARFSSRYDDDERRVTYLMLAAASGSWAMLDDALNRPHNMEAVDSKGRTALEWALWDAPPTEDVFPIVDRLLRHGAKPSDLDKVLHLDCNPNWIPGLVARGGNVNARDAEGNTALFQSCTVEGVKALLKAGADPRVRNNAGKTAIEDAYASKDGKEDSRAAVIREFMAAHAPDNRL